MPLNAQTQEKVAAYAGQDVFYGVRPEFVSIQTRLSRMGAAAKWCAWRTWATNSLCT